MRSRLLKIMVYLWGCGDVVVSTLDFRSEGWWFEDQSL